MNLRPETKATLEDALRELSARQPLSTPENEIVIIKLANDAELDEVDRRRLAIALQGKAMYEGPESFGKLAAIARELRIEQELNDVTTSWLMSRPQRPRVQVMPVETQHTGRCESLWRPDLECPNAAEFILRVRSNKGFAVMCAVHAKGYLEQYRGNDLDVIAYTEEELHACTEARKQVEANQP